VNPAESPPQHTLQIIGTDGKLSATDSARVVALAALKGLAPDASNRARLPGEWSDALVLVEQAGDEGRRAAALKRWRLSMKSRHAKSPETLKSLLADLDAAMGDVADGRIAAPAGPIPAELSDVDLGIFDLSTVAPVEIRWLWPDRIPLGKLTLLAGYGGIGKTFLTLDIITKVSMGRPFPDCPHIIPEGPVDSIFLTAEDDLGDTIVPRLMAMGADLKRVRSLTTTPRPDDKFEPFSLRDVPRLEAVLKKYPATRLIVIDPITAFLGRGTDDAKNTDIRDVLTPVADLAARYGVAIIAITHLNKSNSGRFSDKILGSVAYNNVARCTLAVGIDPENEDRRIVAVAKNNLSPVRTSVAYTLEDGVIHWEHGTTEEKADDLLGAASKTSSEATKREAIDAIRAALSSRPMSMDDLLLACKARGVSKTSVVKYKVEAGAVPERAEFQGKVQWKLATATAPPAGAPY
jgi:hypothetical protein